MLKDNGQTRTLLNIIFSSVMFYFLNSTLSFLAEIKVGLWAKQLSMIIKQISIKNDLMIYSYSRSKFCKNIKVHEKRISMKNVSQSVDQVTGIISLDQKQLPFIWQKFQICAISRESDFSEGSVHTYYQAKKLIIEPINGIILVELLSSGMVLVLGTYTYVTYTFKIKSLEA